MNTEEFIKKAKEIHHDFYDYSLTEFVNYKTKVKIIDKDYGVFYMLPHNHLNGQGCPQRQYQNRTNATLKFIEKVRKVHKDIDLTNMEYNGCDKKIIAICHKKDDDGNEHGSFKILPNNLIHEKCPCPKCYQQERSKKLTLTTNECIQNLKKIYGNTLDYSKIEYYHNKKPIIIGCNVKDAEGNKHGFYKTKYCNLQRGLNGCPKCKEQKKENIRKDYEKKFIEKSEKVHHFKYDYSKVFYLTNNKQVIIICPEHGEFKQKPSDHLYGKGCPKCAGNKRKTTEDFINEAMAVHNNLYNYEKTKYINWKTPVVINCPKHGDFWQTPSHHIQRRHGCPKCKQSKLENEVEEILKNNNIVYVSQCHSNTFKWLNFQSFDFYLPDYNIAIECQGIQHFETVEFFNSVTFEKRLELDRQKFKLCNKNNLKLIYYTKESLPEWVENKDLYFNNTKDIIKFIKEHGT